LDTLYAVLFYIIFAVLVNYHNVNNKRYITTLKIVSERRLDVSANVT